MILRSGMRLAGRYLLHEPLGRGGMGEVWRGQDERLHRPVAVKMLPPTAALDRDAVARFRREAEIAANLDHPGITTVFDIDEHVEESGETLLFLVMELLRGRDLHAVVAQHPGGVPIGQVTEFGRQVLEALGAAHEQGVTHRDIKPANLFLLTDGRVKVCDFGIARLADATRITSTGGITGTPLYMAPEQIRGGSTDRRTDLYSFGCVLYELLTGAVWVDPGTGVASLLYQHLDRVPAAPSSRRPEIPEHLDRLVLSLLAKDPADRPPTAAAALALLNTPGSTSPTDPPPTDPSPAEPLPVDPSAAEPAPAEPPPVDPAPAAPAAPPPPTAAATAAGTEVPSTAGPGTTGPAGTPRPPGERRKNVLTGVAALVAIGAFATAGYYMTGDRWWRDPPVDVHPLRTGETASGSVLAQGETARIPFVYETGPDQQHTSLVRTTLGVTVTSITVIRTSTVPGTDDSLYCVHFRTTNLGTGEMPAELPTDGVTAWNADPRETFTRGLLDGIENQTVNGRQALLVEGVLSDGTTTSHLNRGAIETPTCRPHAPGRVAVGQSVEQGAVVSVPAGSPLTVTGARWTEPSSTAETPATDDAHTYWVRWK
ncbi:serine/threonine-protein kinase [Kitasatospora sp. NPDC088134]|uniref:serine/threonine-protein kinase n=1 Tax=Kitasatospora sp. NPDC088134 TaxID=3364071 RepID=UPI0037F4F579